MTEQVRRVRVLINPRSGVWWSFEGVRKALDETWDVDGIDLAYQVSRHVRDGVAKARRAIEDGVDTLIVVGGDGMVNTIGGALVGTDTALAVIPAGSGNGFARHFGIPLTPERAVKVLKEGRREVIDVGIANERAFFVTCSLAWDADIVRGFEESPVRGILPYVFAGIYRFFTYEPQDFTLVLDGETLLAKEPLVLTVANLTQYGGGAKIAPDARPDDGHLELVMVPKSAAPKLLPELHRLFTGTISQVPMVTMRRFKRMEVHRSRPDPIQVDGELIDAPEQFTIEVRPAALQVIVPAASARERRRWSQE